MNPDSLKSMVSWSGDWLQGELAGIFILLLLVALCILLPALIISARKNRAKDLLLRKLQGVQERHQRDAEKYNSFLQHGSFGCLVINSECSNILEANSALCLMLGRTEQEMTDRPVQDLLDDRSLERLRKLSSSGGDQGHSAVFETSLLHADGHSISVMLSCVASETEDFGLVLVTDISHLKVRDRELPLFKKAFEHSADAIVITDNNGLIQHVNPSFFRLTGYMVDEAVGQKMSILKSGQHGKKFYQELWSTITHGGIWRGRIINMRKDGSTYWESMAVGPIYDDHNTITHFVAIKSDISKPVAMELELTRFRQAVDQSPNGFLLTDDRWRVNYANQAWANMHGYALEKVQEMPVQVFYSPLRDKELDVPFSAQVYEKNSFSGEMTQWRKDGTHFPSLTTATRIVLEDSLHDEFMIFSKDISEQMENFRQLQEAKEQALVASQAKSTFLANMSHEIRTPMNAIMGMAHLLKDSEITDKQENKLDLILNASEALLELVNDILDYSKVEAGKLALEIRPFEISSLLADVVGILGNSAKRKGLELKYGIKGADGYFKGDALRLRQVLLNLAGNAIKFTEQGKVELSVLLQPDDGGEYKAFFSVKDTGIGINRAQHDVIFESFSQADVSMTRKYGGTGLGLVISRQLVELMGGKISLESSPGQGSLFSFTLSLERAEGPVRPGEVQKQVAGSVTDLDILLVEDNSANRQLATMILHKLGHKVTSADNGFHGLEILAEAEFDLVLMDIQMPKMDGVTATRIIRQLEKGKFDSKKIPMDLAQKIGNRLEGHHLPIIAITANALPEDREQCFAEGVDDYLTKPYNPDMLNRALILCSAKEENSKVGLEASMKTTVDNNGGRESGLGGQILQHLMNEYELDQASAQEVLDMYRNSLQEGMDALESALTAGDLGEVERQAHAVKGALLNIGLDEQAEIAKTMEFSARKDEACDYSGMRAKLYDQISALFGV